MPKTLSYQIAVSDHELRDISLGSRWLMKWIKERLVQTLDRAAPHGEIEFWTHRNGKLKLTKYEAIAEWKEPIQ